MGVTFNPFTGELQPSGSSSGGGGGITLQPDHGTSPTGTMFTVTSGDSSLSITGNSTTDTLDLRLNRTLATGGISNVGLAIQAASTALTLPTGTMIYANFYTSVSLDVCANGGGTITNPGPALISGNSLDLSGGKYIRIDTATNTELVGAFTLQGKFTWNSNTSNQYLFGAGNSGFTNLIFVSASASSIEIYFANSSGGYTHATFSWSATLGQTYEHTLACDGTTGYYYVDGTLVWSAACDGNGRSASPIYIGANGYQSGGNGQTGYAVTDFIVISGAAHTGSSYTPSHTNYGGSPQAADLFQAKSSGGAVLASLGSSGGLKTPTLALTASGTATSATAGSATLPSAPLGFVTVSINGTNVKLPYYGV